MLRTNINKKKQGDSRSRICIYIERCNNIQYNAMSPLQIFKFFTSYQVPFNVALKNKTSEDVSLLVIDSIVDGNSKFLVSIPNQFQTR